MGLAKRTQVSHDKTRRVPADTRRIGVGEGSWEAGSGKWDYKDLPLPGSQETNDHRLGASYSYDPWVRIQYAN